VAYFCTTLLTANKPNWCTVDTAHFQDCITVLFQESLLNYRNHWFTEEAPQKVMDEFRSSLRHISEGMKRRNKQLATPFDYLLPEKIYMRFDD